MIGTRFVNATRVVGRMSWSERRELVVVSALAVYCEALIRWIPLRRLARSFGVALSSGSEATMSQPVGSLPGWATDRLRITNVVMRNWPVSGVCLRHSLVAGQRVRRLHPVLRIGVADPTSSGFDAHAWLEIGGRSLDVESDRYLVFEL